MRHFIEPIRIGERLVGPGLPAYIVAEVGINHNGDLSLAKEMINAAKEAGACAVKFQNYKVEDFIANSDLTITYPRKGEHFTETQTSLFERCELKDEDLRELIEYCHSKNIDFHSTPTNINGVSLLVDCGVKVLKNGSDFLSNTYLVEAMAKTSIPVVLSTGMATLCDLETAVRCFKKAGGRELIILHCVSQYPAPHKELNLRRIRTIQNLFNVPVGFSDHSQGFVASAVSISQGACWVEKHFTLDKSMDGPDHYFSSDPEELKLLVSSIRGTEQMLGGPGTWELSEGELQSRTEYRLSLAAARDLSVGHTLTVDDIAFLRPGNGFHPGQRELFVGRILKNRISKGKIFELDDLS